MRRLAWLLLLWGCGSDVGTPGELPDAAAPDAAASADPSAPVYLGCNVVATPCVLPFPSSVLSRPDPSSPTGVRVDLSGRADFGGIWARLAPEAPDGFSPLGPIVTRLAGPVPDGALPIEPEASADASVVLVGVRGPDAGTRVPFRAEAVRSAMTGDTLLVIMPARPLAPASRYAVAITDGLQPLSARTAAMTRLLDPAPADDPLWRHDQPLIDAVGVDRAKIVQLWDFDTRSAAGITSDFEAMAAYTLDWLRQHPPAPRITGQDRAGTRDRYFVEVDVPIWHDGRDAPLNRGPDGKPTPLRTEALRGYLIVPDGVTSAHPLVFGHGLGANAQIMSAVMGSVELEGGPFAALLFDWDLHGTRGRGVDDIGAIAGDLNTPAFAAAMLQSAADFLVLRAAAARLPALPGRGAVVAAEPALYLGQSFGGLIGAVAASQDPTLRAAVLNVTGGGMGYVLRTGRVGSLLRLTDRVAAGVPADSLEGIPQDLIDDVLAAVGQIGLDAGDPLNFAPLVHGPALLLQESIGDGIMPNLATESLARALKLPQIEPALHEAPGLERASAPTAGHPASGLTQFRTSADDFNAHLAFSATPVQRQAMVWLASFVDAGAPDGDITYDCPDGDCDLVH